MRLGLSVLLFACAASPAAATVTAYDSYADFLAALGALPLVSEGYESGSPDQVIASGTSFDGIGYEFSGGRAGRIGYNYAHFGMFGLEALADGTGPDYFDTGDTVTLHFATPVSIVGGFFSANPGTGADPYFLRAGGATATGGGAGDALDVPDHYFLGLISTSGAFTSATFGSLASAEDGSYTLDDILYQPSVAGLLLPEPGTWATMLLGFGLAGVAMRRRIAPARA